MSMLCPRCQKTFAGHLRCPDCNVSLVPSNPARLGITRFFVTKAKWQHTIWGRCLIGLLVAQGLYYVLLQLTSAVVLLTGMQASEIASWHKSFAGLMVQQALQAVSLLVGGMLAGAGHRKGMTYGTIVGVYNVMLLLLVKVLTGADLKQIAGDPLLMLLLFSQPPLQVVFGAIGGYLGHTIWKPMLPVVVERPVPGPPGIIPTTPEEPSPLAGPISWFRITLGAAVAMVGTMSASSILNLILTSEATKEGLDTWRQANFIIWEVAVLAIILGGAVAGSGSSNGVKQGLIYGIVSCVVLVIYYENQNREVPQTLVYKMLDLSVVQLIQKIFFTMLSVLPLGAIGGWFGSQLMPPLAHSRRKKQKTFFPVQS